MRMTRMVVRRIQKVGTSTYTVSLPKEWVESRGLGARSEVEVQIMEDGSIRISTMNSKKKEKEIVIKEKERDAGFLTRKMIAAYMAGYDVIKIDLSEIEPELKIREKLRKTIKNKMAGAEIIEESMNNITIQVILRSYEYPLGKILIRMASLVHDMILDVCKALSTRNKEVLLDVIERDDDVDKLYFMGSRWLASIIEDGYGSNDIKSSREALEYRVIFRHVERVADHVCKIANILLNSMEKIDEGIADIMKELLEKAGAIFVKSINCINSVNLIEANKVIHDARAMIKSSEDLLMSGKLKTMDNLIIALDSMRRIAEYGIGISEIAFNIGLMYSKRSD